MFQSTQLIDFNNTQQSGVDSIASRLLPRLFDDMNIVIDNMNEHKQMT